MRSWRLLAVAAGTLAIAATVVVVVLARGRGAVASTGAYSVAVMPLRSIGGMGAHGDADRVTEELTTALIQSKALVLRVVPPNGVTLGREGDVQRLGRQLGVAYVLDGALQRTPERMRVTLRLVRTTDGISIWAGTFDSNLGDPIARALQVTGEASAQIKDRLAQR